MDRNFTASELTTLIDHSMKSGINLLPYCCRENMDCWIWIERSIRVVKKYDITPEKYWHGNEKEFLWLLILLGNDYPSPKNLLSLAEVETKYEIKNIADHFYQHICVMFELFKTHHGYVVLKPSGYMQTLYPDSKDIFYVYTTDKWNHSDNMGIDGTVLTFHANQLDEFPKLLKKKLGIIA